MKIQEYNADDVVVNKAISARKGDPDPEDVGRMAGNFADRVSKKLDHQIQPGIVRLEKGTVELVAGRHRLEAVKVYNKNRGEGEEPLMFLAITIKAGDEEGLVTAITENEYRTASDVFDRAEAIQKLVDMGRAQKDIAVIFGLSEGTISQMVKVAALEKKYVKAVRDGDLEQDAAIMIAGLDVKDSKRQEIFEECIRHRTRFDEIANRLEIKKQRSDADAAVEEAKRKADEIELREKEARDKLKNSEKAVKEAAKSQSSATDVKEIEAARKVQDEAIAERAKAEAEVKEAEKAKVKAVKELDKAKQAKTKVIEETKVGAKTKVTPEDVKRIAKEKGVKSKVTDKPTPVTKQGFYVAIEAMTEGDKTLPKSVGNLVGKIQAYLDGEISDTQLKTAFKTNCVPDKK